MKRISTLFILLLCSFTSFATVQFTSCPQASDTNTTNFCATFKTAAACHCMETGLPSAMCNDMGTVYNLMIARYGNVQKACQAQTDTPTQTCIDDWSCYRSGGVDSKGRKCSSTGNACS